MNITRFISNLARRYFSPISPRVRGTILLLERQPNSFMLSLERRSGQLIIILKLEDESFSILLSPDNLWIHDMYVDVPPLNYREKTKLLDAVRSWLVAQE